MVHSKNRNCSGFMLMEVMVTIAIVGLVIAPVFMLQSSALRGLRRFSDKIRILFPARNFLIDALDKAPRKKETEATETKKITNPSATITYKMNKVGQGSAFKEIKDIYINDVRIRSSRGERESIVGFIYKPEREKK